MWQVEATNPNGDFYIKSSMSQAASRTLHGKLSNSGKWASVRSFDMEYVKEQAEAAERIRKFKGKLSV